MAVLEIPISNGGDERAMRSALEMLPESTRRANECALQRLSNACGCAEGAVGALVLVALVVARFIHAFSGWSLPGIALLIVEMLAAFLIGGFAGKFLGLAIARARLRNLRNRIRRQAGQAGS